VEDPREQPRRVAVRPAPRREPGSPARPVLPEARGGLGMLATSAAGRRQPATSAGGRGRPPTGPLGRGRPATIPPAGAAIPVAPAARRPPAQAGRRVVAAARARVVVRLPRGERLTRQGRRTTGLNAVGRFGMQQPHEPRAVPGRLNRRVGAHRREAPARSAPAARPAVVRGRNAAVTARSAPPTGQDRRPTSRPGASHCATIRVGPSGRRPRTPVATRHQQVRTPAPATPGHPRTVRPSRAGGRYRARSGRAAARAPRAPARTTAAPHARPEARRPGIRGRVAPGAMPPQVAVPRTVVHRRRGAQPGLRLLREGRRPAAAPARGRGPRGLDARGRPALARGVQRQGALAQGVRKQGAQGPRTARPSRRDPSTHAGRSVASSSGSRCPTTSTRVTSTRTSARTCARSPRTPPSSRPSTW